MTRTIAVSMGILILFVGIAALVTQLLVKPVSTDLGLIGQGKPVLVLAYENFSPTGGDALDRLRRVRADYAARMHFVVADLGVPEGRRFAQRHQLVDGQAVFLSPTGEPIRVISIPADEQVLRSGLDYELAAAGFPD